MYVNKGFQSRYKMKHLPLDTRYENHCHANIRSYIAQRTFIYGGISQEKERERENSSLNDTSTYTDEEQAPWMRLGLSQGLPTATRILQHLHTVQVRTVTLKKRTGLDAKYMISFNFTGNSLYDAS